MGLDPIFHFPFRFFAIEVFQKKSLRDKK